MLKERHRLGVAAAVPRVSRNSRAPHEVHRSIRASGAVAVPSPPEVGIIPGNRFVLVPIKKVTALLRPHTPCREPSETTKPCIVSKAAAPTSGDRASHGAPGSGWQPASRHDGAPKLQSKQLITKPRRHHRQHPAVAKTRLSPVLEQAQAEREPLLVLATSETRLRNAGIASSSVRESARLELLQHQSWRSKGTSVFTLNERPATQQLALSGRAVAQDFSRHGAPAAIRSSRESSSIFNVSDLDLGRNRSRGGTRTRFGSAAAADREGVDRGHDPREAADQEAGLWPKGGARSFGRNNRVSPSSSRPGVDHHMSILQARGEDAQHRVDREWGAAPPPSPKRGTNHRSAGSCAAVSHQIRSSSPFLCSFANAEDLPLAPSPRSRRLPKRSTSSSRSQP